jgi:hypothetical protein
VRQQEFLLSVVVRPIYLKDNGGTVFDRRGGPDLCDHLKDLHVSLLPTPFGRWHRKCRVHLMFAAVLCVQAVFLLLKLAGVWNLVTPVLKHEPTT